MYGVREALSHLNFLGNVHPGVELPVSIEKEHISKSPLQSGTGFPTTRDSLIVYELLDWLKSINHFQYTLGTVTQVAFP